MSRSSRSSRDEEAASQPDYRFTLANERTFLAWMRTCLALLAVGVALDQFAPHLGSRTFRDLTGVALSLLAGYTALGGLWRWSWNQQTMARGGRLRPGPLPTVLSIGLALVTVAVVVALLRDLGS